MLPSRVGAVVGLYLPLAWERSPLPSLFAGGKSSMLQPPGRNPFLNIPYRRVPGVPLYPTSNRAIGIDDSDVATRNPAPDTPDSGVIPNSGAIDRGFYPAWVAAKPAAFSKIHCSTIGFTSSGASSWGQCPTPSRGIKSSTASN